MLFWVHTWRSWELSDSPSMMFESKSRSLYPERLAWCRLSAWRIRVAPVTVTFTNSTITAMNEQLATLMARDFAGDANRFGLSIGARRYARTAFGTNRPLSVAWNYVLIWHIFFTPFQKIADLWLCRVKFGQEISLLAHGPARQGGAVASGQDRSLLIATMRARRFAGAAHL